ncbi:MAG: hypothetical protein V4553_11235 [Bacteroidota bacterium]
MQKQRINVCKWWIFTVLCVFLLAPQTTKAQTGKREFIEAFLTDVINVNITGETLMKKYMCAPNKDTQQALDLELYRLRMKMLGQSKKVTNHFEAYLKPYRELPEEEQDILIDAKDKDNIFSFKGEQGIAVLILIKDGKIASFTIVKKGNTRVFTTYCN